MKRKKKSVGGGQGRCERRSEAFVKIQKKLFIFFVFVLFFCCFFFLGGGVLVGGGGGGVRVDVN